MQTYLLSFHSKTTPFYVVANLKLINSGIPIILSNYIINEKGSTVNNINTNPTAPFTNPIKPKIFPILFPE